MLDLESKTFGMTGYRSLWGDLLAANSMFRQAINIPLIQIDSVYTAASSLLKTPPDLLGSGSRMFESRKAASETQQDFWIETRRLPLATASTFYRKLGGDAGLDRLHRRGPRHLPSGLRRVRLKGLRGRRRLRVPRRVAGLS